MDIPTTHMPLRCFALCLSFGLLAVASSPAPCFAEGYPSHAIDPVIVEYDPDPAWPNRPDTVAPFGWVSGIAIDNKNQVWVFNRGEDPVQVYTTDGEFVRTWGKGDFSNPHQIRIGPAGNVWVADFGLHTVQKFTPQGELLMTLGVRGEKGDDETHFNMPTDMAVTPAGDIFVTDGYGNRRVVHFDKDGRFVKSWGEYGSGPGQFVLPHAIVVDSKGLLYVADRNSGRIEVFDQQGKLLDTWSNLMMPWGLSVRSDGQIWVCGSSPHWWVRDGKAPEYKDQILMRFRRDGAVQQVWSLPLGDIGSDKDHPDTSRLKPGETVGVHCIVQDSQGNLYVGDIYGQRAQKLVPVTTRAASK
jgi:6-bladed beta-propeller/NHL repeat